MLSSAVSYKPMELVDIFQGCSHTVRLVVYGGRNLTTEGM
jgi:hypothetical protein